MKNRNSTPNRYEYLTQTPVPKLISTLAVPTILSMLVTGIYNTADTFFVGRISTQATAAVGLVFSVMAVIQAMGFFCGQGSGTYLSRMLGAGKKQEANEVAATGFALALILGVIVAILGNVFTRPLGYALGAGDTTIHDTLLYMRIILLGAFYFHWHPLAVYACTCLDEVGKIPWVMARFRKYKWVQDLTQ